MSLDYRNKKISLLTKHGKEKIIAPIMEEKLGCQIQLINAFDTDELGTFDGVIDRQGTQVQTARRKAHIGIDFSSNNVGVASEGSFVPDPFSGFMPWNIEMVVFVDDLHAIEVVGMAQGSAMSMNRLVRDVDSLLAFADQAGFPTHQSKALVLCLQRRSAPSQASLWPLEGPPLSAKDAAVGASATAAGCIQLPGLRPMINSAMLLASASDTCG